MDAVATLRRFNRTYTQRIGVLEESFLGTGRPLGVSRLLYEVGAADGEIAVGDLRDRLDLDAGYLSRLLRRLEDDGLVRVVPDASDGRRRVVRSTAAGREAFDDLEHRSVDLAERLVAPLTERQQARLSEALATADLLVRAATVRLRAIDPTAPAAREAVRRYVAELDARFPGGFAPGEDAVEPGAVYVVATSDGRPVAYGGVRPAGEESAEIKRMWVDDSWRGAGLGSRMLRHLEELARQQGYRRVVLDTHGSLTEAIALYERSGYTPIERYNENPFAQAFFAKDL